MKKLTNAITDIPGIEVGHADDPQALTGCTVILSEGGAVGGVDQRGGSPGTRETDLLRPLHRVEKVHAVLLTGGSAFGLDAAGGVVHYLEERGIGFDAQVAKVPIVPAAVLFDLGLGSADVRPDAAMGYAACVNASTSHPREGNAGAGMGASVGKILGPAGAMKSGIGTACIEIGRGVRVGAIVAVNALGDVVDPATGAILAGTRAIRVAGISLTGAGPFADTQAIMLKQAGKLAMKMASGGNTVIGVVATNARLTKNEANFVAQMAQDGLARAIRPAHTMFDGDTLFALSTGKASVDINTVGAYAADAVQAAILQAVRQAASAGGLPSMREIGSAGSPMDSGGRE